MRCSFEPNRLSPVFLAQAYEKIIPQTNRVIRLEGDKGVGQQGEDRVNQSRRVS